MKAIRTNRDKAMVDSCVANGDKLIDLMLEDIDSSIDELDRSTTAKQQYQLASWPHYQAHKNGCREVLTGIKKYLDNARKGVNV